MVQEPAKSTFRLVGHQTRPLRRRSRGRADHARADAGLPMWKPALLKKPAPVRCDWPAGSSKVTRRSGRVAVSRKGWWHSRSR